MEWRINKNRDNFKPLSFIYIKNYLSNDIKPLSHPKICKNSVWFYFFMRIKVRAHTQAHVGGESDHIQGWQGSILKPIGDRWSNPPIYMFVILSLILPHGAIISNSHVGFTLNRNTWVLFIYIHVVGEKLTLGGNNGE